LQDVPPESPALRGYHEGQQRLHSLLQARLVRPSLRLPAPGSSAAAH
jgi:hypothetical protein